MPFRHFFTGILTMAVLLLVTTSGWAVFGEDIERPQPKFIQEGEDWIAELIPRGKSTRVQIRFHAEGGTLAEPVPKIFGEADGPKIDIKNYRSGFYVVNMTPDQKGGEMALSMGSTYFNSATDIWGVTQRATRTWGTTGVITTSVKGEPTTLRFVVQDGSVLDEDGEANGRIQVVIGPRDHFWGYAIGTLVIRFFGVFLVLGILMIGMIISGKVFQALEKTKHPASPLLPDGDEPDELYVPGDLDSLDASTELESPASGPDPVQEVSPAVAAAIGLALHLHGKGSAAPRTLSSASSVPASSNWSFSGRTQIMADRRGALGRVQHKK